MDTATITTSLKGTMKYDRINRNSKILKDTGTIYCAGNLRITVANVLFNIIWDLSILNLC